MEKAIQEYFGQFKVLERCLERQKEIFQKQLLIKRGIIAEEIKLKEGINKEDQNEEDKGSEEKELKVKIIEETVDNTILGWFGIIEKKVTEAIAEKNNAMGELMDKLKSEEGEIRVKIDNKYKAVVPKPGKLPEHIYQSVLKKVQTNRDADLNKSLSSIKEKEKTEKSKLLELCMSKIKSANSNQQILEIGNKIKEIIKNTSINDSPSNKSNERFLSIKKGQSPERKLLHENLAKNNIPINIPKIENTEDILNSLNLNNYNKDFIANLKKTTNTGSN